MKSNWTLVIVLCVVLLSAMAVLAGDNDAHQVTVTVTAINELAVSGGDITLTISSATPGSDPTDATDNTCGLDWTTNEASKKITVESDQASPTFTLKVQASSVTGGSGTAQVTITNAAQDFVTGVATTTGSCTLDYTASATAAQGTGSDVHTITYTITDS